MPRRKHFLNLSSCPQSQKFLCHQSLKWAPIRAQCQSKTILNSYWWNEAGDILTIPRTFLTPNFLLVLKGRQNTCEGKVSYRQTRYWEKPCRCFFEALIELLSMPYKVGAIIVLTFQTRTLILKESNLPSAHGSWQVVKPYLNTDQIDSQRRVSHFVFLGKNRNGRCLLIIFVEWAKARRKDMGNSNKQSSVILQSIRHWINGGLACPQ